jgi:hypothetical protein
MRAALSRSFRDFPGTGDVLARLNSELVETEAEGPESGAADFDAGSTGSEGGIDLTGAPVLVIDWSNAVLDEQRARDWLLQKSGLTVSGWYAAGGALEPELDAVAIEGVAGQGGASNVLVLVKAWEPPMADLFDFLRELRARVKHERMILIAPLGRDASGSVCAADPDALETWRKTIARTGDPWLRVLHPGAPR